jgi:hypothetical protein
MTLLLLAFLLEARAAPPAPQPFGMKERDTVVVSPVIRGRSWWARAGATTKLVPGKTFGADLGAGYQGRMLGFDVKALIGKTTLEAIFVEPNYLDTVDSSPFGGSLAPESELNRSRAATDPWSLFVVEPGIAVNTKLLPDELPQFSQRARVGLGWGTFSDSTRALSFSALLFSAEAGFQYHFPHSPYSVELAPALRWGRLLTSGEGSPQTRRLPVVFTTLSLSVLYWF